MATIAENIQRIQAAKASLKTAIEAKGVTVPSSATIDTYPTYVSQIPAGGGDDSTLKDLIEGDITSITIPSGTTSIRSNAFSGCTSLSSVTIPNSVTSIGNSAFGVCTSLSSVTIPDSVTSIGNSAFTNCKMESIVIPDTVTSIGESAFYNCRYLSSVTIGSGVTVLQGFDSCNSLSSITIPSSVTSIGQYAFFNCGLRNITIPDSVTSIGNHAFESCFALTSATIGNSVTSIGNDAFYQCSGLTEVTIPSGVTSIGDKAFGYCSGLTSVAIPDGVTSIGQNTFNNCRGLTSIDIPDSVTNISNSAFYDCRGLTSVTIGSGVTSIGSYTFANCTGLTSLTVEATTPPTLGNANAFNNTNNCPIYVPSGSVETYKAANRWSTYASRIQAIPSPQPPVQCETPESTETFALDDDFDTTKEVWNLWPDNSAELDGDEMTGEEEYYFTGYVVLSEDGQTPDYTIVADMNDEGTSEVDICEYDANGENFAGTVLTALTEDLYIGMCDYFQKPMYVMDFSQYEVSQWQSYHAGDTVPSGVINGVRLYQNQGDGITFSGQSGTIAFEFDGSDWTATDGNYDPVDISGYYDSNNNTYTILFSDLGYADGMEITTPSPELEETFSFDLDLYAVTQKVNEFEVDTEAEE